MARTSESLTPPAAFDMARILAGGRNWWAGMAPSTRRTVVIGAVVLAAAAIGVSLLFFQNPMTVVYANLTAADAGTITQTLQQDKIPYELQGTTILVPRSMSDQVRVNLAMQGLPHQGTVGYANVLQSIGLGETSSEFNLAVLDALQSDLGTTISSIRGVKSATVAIVMPQTSAFIDQPQAAASASVFVDLNPGVTLSGRQVQGIMNLVAHAVPGLTTKNISVTDQLGDPLTAQASGSDPSTVTGQMAIERSFEKTLDSEITQLLTPIAGAGNVVVDTHANLNFDQTTTSQTTFQPLANGQGVPVSNHTISETFSGTGSPPSVAGSGSNSVPTYSQTGSGGNSSMKYTDSSIDYAVSKVNKTVTSQPYTVQGLTVSVTLNSSAYHLTSANTAALLKLIGTAIGSTSASQTAQDVTIFSSPFSRPKVTPPPPPAATSPSIPEIAGAAAALLAVLGGAFFFLRRRKKSEEWTPLTPPQAAAPQYAAAAEAPGPSARPEDMAQVIRAWLREDVREKEIT